MILPTLSIMSMSPDPADAPDDGYRPVSGLAVASVVFGGLSALAIFSPAAMALPLVGTFVSVLALREFIAPGVAKIGRTAALVGLALSLGFAGQSVATATLTHWLRGRRVEKSVQILVNAICADDMAALATMLSPLLVPRDEEPDVGVAMKPDPAVVHTALRRTPIVTAMRSCCPAGTTKITCTGHRPDSKEAREAWLATVDANAQNELRDVHMELELSLNWVKSAAGWSEVWTVEKYDVSFP